MACEADSWTAGRGTLEAERSPKPSESALERINEEQLRRIVEHLPYFACVVDRERRYLWVNHLDPTLEEDAVIGRRVDDYVDESMRETMRDHIERAFAQGEESTYDVRGYGDGEWDAWYRTRVVPLPPVDGVRHQVLLLSSDVTEQKRAELALQKSEARFRSVTEASPDYLAVLDAELRITYINRDPPIPGAASREQLVGSFIGELIQPPERELALATLRGVLRTGSVGSYEARGSGADNLWRVRVVPLSDDPDERLLLISTDITAQRRAETQRMELQKHLEQAQRLESIGQLAGGIAHDFNNLLQIIHGQAELLMQRRPELRDLEDVHELLAATDKAGGLTARLLAFGRRQPTRARPITLSALVGDSARMLERTLPETVRLEVVDRSQDARVKADPGQLDQVLINLCVNARDALDGKGRIAVEIDQTEVVQSDAIAPLGSRSGPHVVLTVRDDGAGMAEDVRARIFEPFFTTKPPDVGTGLGLPMVQGIVTQHGGFVRVDSAPGEGTAVHVFLPAHVGPAPEVEQPVARAPSRGGGETILVAEDNDLVRRAIVRMLESGGYRVLQAHDGAAALELLDAEDCPPVELAVLDAVMPRLGGQETYLSLLERLPGLPVLFSSGYSADALPADFLAEHDLTVLLKPYTMTALLDAVRGLLDAGRRPRRDASQA